MTSRTPTHIDQRPATLSLPEEGIEMPVTRSRARAEESPTEISATRTLQTLLLEVRALREEQARKEVLHAEELWRRDEELQRLQLQLSPSNFGARGDLIPQRDRENLRETPVRVELGYKLKPDTERCQEIFFPI